MNHTQQIQKIKTEIEDLEEGLRILEDNRLGGKTKPIYVLEAEIRKLKQKL